MREVDKPKNNGETKVIRNEKGQIMPGSVLNPNGNPGAGYKQKWDKMITNVAEEKGITKEQAELDLFTVAYDQALKGNFQFFKDAMDRVYGPVRQDATLNVEKLENLTIVLDRDED